MDKEEHTLVVSSNRGRYALDDEHGSDISSGQKIEILLNGQWIAGSIEHAGQMYVNRGMRVLGEKLPDEAVFEGYYFLTDEGICGLCVGMRIRLRR